MNDSPATIPNSGMPLSPRGAQRILCVDDEPNILTGLSRQLHGCGYEVLTAGSAAEGLELLHRNPSVAVVIADMRMPGGADGASMLRLSRKFAPDATRIVLTGQADHASAVAAVNQGQIFAYLEKPCPATTLISTVHAAVARYRLASARALLLEEARRTRLADAETVFDELFARISGCFGSDYAALGLNDAAPWPPREVCAAGLDPALFRQDQVPATLAVLRESAGPMQLPARSGEAVGGLPDGHPPVGRLLAVPLADDCRCHGWMYFADRRRSEPFLPDDEEAATILATVFTRLCEKLARPTGSPMAARA
jgi:CheY-like chemotaxis protein